MKETIKYVRAVGNNLIIAPTKEGLAVLEKKLATPLGKDVIVKEEIAAFVLDLKSPIKFFRIEQQKSRNTNVVYAYTEGNTKFGITFPMFVEVVEAAKKVEEKREENKEEKKD